MEDSGLLNRTVLPDSAQGPALADAVEQALGGSQGKIINVGARDDAYGNGLVKSFGRAWKAGAARSASRSSTTPSRGVTTQRPPSS